MNKTNPTRHTLSILITACIACMTSAVQAQNSPPATTVQAPHSSPVVNGSRIERSLIEQGMQKALEAGLPNNATTRELVESELIAREILRQEAKRQGLDQHPDVQRAMREAADAAMIQLLIKTATITTPVSEAELRQRYEQTVASLGKIEFKARILSVRDEALVRRLQTEFSADPEHFDTLAKKHSQDLRAAQGGAMEWISFPVPVEQGKTQSLPLAVAVAMAQLRPGEVSAPVLANDNWHLIKLEALRPTVIPGFEEAKANIRVLLERQRKEQASAALMGRLIGAAKIER